MHRALSTFVLAGIALLATTVQRADARIDEDLADEIIAMKDKSDKVHKPLLTNRNDQQQILKAIAQEQENMKRMRAIVQKHGWPGKSLVGEEAATAAVILVAQSNVDRDFQKGCLQLMEKEAKKGEVDWKDVAFATDVIRVTGGDKQRYGTQFRYDAKKGKVTILPIEDEKNVDKRRKEVGMLPLAEFKKQLEEQLNMRQQNQ